MAVAPPTFKLTKAKIRLFFARYECRRAKDFDKSIAGTEASIIFAAIRPIARRLART